MHDQNRQMSMINIKFQNVFACLISLLLANTVFAQQLAITMDNPTTKNSTMISNKAIDKSILNALNKHNLKIILFVQGEQVDSKDGHALLERWRAAGHAFGNHTYSHHNL